MTLEPGGPENDERSKLDRGLELLASLDEPSIPADEIARWKEIQASAPLRWGTWLGLRQSGAGLRSKLYVEMPRRAAVPREYQHPLGDIRMLGYEPATGRTEFYHALRETTPMQLRQTAGTIGLAASAALFDVLTDCSGLPLESMLRFNTLGLSNATQGSKPVPGMTLFFRGAFRSRARLRRLLSAAENGMPSPPYARLLDGVADGDLPDHGLISVTVRDDATMEIRAGLSAAAILSRKSPIAAQVA